MRLVCPNCDAQYEVDDHAIPDTGRDVQCSNCGHAWFQLPPDLAPVDDDDTGDETADDPGAALPPPPPEVPDYPAAPGAEAGPPADPSPPADPPPAAPPPRRTIDDAVLAVLREEAEREVAARKAEARRAIETQPDLGLPAAPPAPRPAPAPEPEPEPEPERPVTQRPGPNRRDLLPDIEEINSTLRTGSEARPDDAPAAALPADTGRSGFRTGFVSMLVVAAMLVALYVMAPRIARHLPGAASAMESYVQTVDSLRSGLDRAMQGIAGRLRGMSGQGG